MARLEVYAEHLVRAHRGSALMSRAGLADLWRRHMLDSAQLLPLAPGRASVWVDLGSGAGFPGMVLAIMGAAETHLIESNALKCRFLESVARATRTEVHIHHARIEGLEPWAADVVTARALAPFAALVDLARPFFAEHTVGLFPKGQDVERELTEAPKYRTIDVERVSSVTSERGTVLVVRGLSHLRTEP